MKIGIMGGTFDPIHIGHLVAAETVREGLGLDEVWFMPSHIPPHKAEAGFSGEERMHMVELAIGTQPAFRTLDIELRRGGVSYTVDTMSELAGKYPDARFHFIIGTDMVNYLPKWERIEELAGLTRFAAVGRAGYELDKEHLPAAVAEVIDYFDMPQLELSSTEIRGRLKKGRSTRYLVPEKVHDYLQRSGSHAAYAGTTD
ncbi:nicotinate-nucleotide adenylyltransferase [Saccharibacillus alkalitolerans]|uniref:Probable nicotinate-nucleotide adenylyltransferase n=1 Tax=Saccharibacillus alkalitolerans TaxID=2705290 RepID=A0ABX0F135_9BACL|nr:nicotinate-nucleotide adenylyltransferase [Saccharibacillus alkalitolerans]NGZ73764.1 nicotinate-nucleotide adenylyltransferase [Saccharibacillus alkalitolerans]